MFHSKRPQALRFRFLHKTLAWWMGRRSGPKVKKEDLPLGTLDPSIARIQQWNDQRMHRLAQLWSKEARSLGVEIGATKIALDAAAAELVKLDKELEKQLDLYRRNHDGQEPGRISGVAEIRRWGLMLILGLGEFPLMSAALNRLPIPDWQRLVATAGASILTISLAGLIGRWFAKRGKSIGQAAFGWLMVGLLAGILIATALLRSTAAKENENTPAAVPEVFFNHTGGHSDV